ncbi:SpoIIE family protein phosphatase [Streptomyces longwoodensis]|uniref:SpoIIE family protein phosphatase n=1 Tax=Streptomyces longwoodensis TaxID=68231 RepID=UPI003F4C051D
MTSEPAVPGESGGAPDLAALTRVVARQRAEMDRLQDVAATSAVIERAKGAVMARLGCTPDAAHDVLLQRAKAARRTLLEECWITLGTLAPPSAPAPGPGPYDVDATAPLPAVPPGTAEDVALALARLGRALVRVSTPQDLARCLLEHVAPDVGVDAVLLYARLPAGGLELIGHAGVDDALARQWQQVPPLTGIAPLEALRSGEPRWLEDSRTDRKRYLLIGEPPERWGSRAWLPVLGGSGDVGGPGGSGGPGDERAAVVVGFLRGVGAPFPQRTREHLKAVTHLCAGPLAMFGTRQEPALGSAVDAVQAVFDRLPVQAVLLTPVRAPSGAVEDFRVDAATADTVDSTGRSGRRLTGLRLLECWPSITGEPLWHGCLDTLTRGTAFTGEPFARQRTVGGETELSTVCAHVERLGDGLVLTWLPYDPSDRQEQRLADVQRLGNLGWANWNLAAGDVSWSSQVFTIFERDPALGALQLTDLPELALPEDVPALARAVGELVRLGRPCDVPFRIVTRGGVRHLRAVAEAVSDQYGTPVEVHGFVQDLTAQRSAELALLASERAMLTQHGVLQAERTVAARLQDALLPLPGKPVRLAGLRVEVAYLPAQSGLNVGGDWFSAIQLPDGDALFVLGDVAGHGMDAVATMAQLRFTAKGMVITGSSLTGALNRLSALLLHSRDSHGTATMVLARYNPAERRLVWAQAGHPPPLLVRDGAVRYLDRPAGMLLGASDTPRYGEAECLLQPGDRVVLYTDGLVERPAENIDRGLERLAGAVAAQAAAGTASLDRLLGTLLEAEQRDDVCVLDIRVPEDGATS